LIDDRFRYSHAEPGTDDVAEAANAERVPGLIEQALASGQMMMSVVIPLLNEVDSLIELYHRLKTSLKTSAPSHEIIFVDDGSRDGSFEKLKDFWHSDPCVSVIRFRRNFGKAAALSAGFQRVRGDIVTIMDADLQDQPEELPRLIAKMDEGYDLVTGWKFKRHDPINKTLPSKLFNGTVSKYFNIKIHDFNCGFKIMRASVAREITLYGDMHRFIPVLAADRGYRVAECVVEHAPRVHGVSKYGAKRLVTGLLDFMSTILTTRFLNKPMQFFGGVGLLTSVSGLGVGVFLLVETMIGNGGHIRPLWVIMALLILGGIQMICLGLLAELLVKVSNRPINPYNMREVLPASDADEPDDSPLSTRRRH